MSDEQQKSRLDTLIGIFRAFLRIDPMMALIALLIIAPIAIPIGNAILNGETVVTTTFVIFIAEITFVVYIPLIIVRAWKDKEKALTQERKDSIKKEMDSRIEDKQHARERTDRIVTARLANMEAQTKAIIDNIPHFERFLLAEEAKNIREALDLEFKDEVPKSRLGIIIEHFEAIGRKFSTLEQSIPGLQKTIEEVRNQFLEKPIPLHPDVKSLALEKQLTEFQNSNNELMGQMEGMSVMVQELNDKLLEKEIEIDVLKGNISVGGISPKESELADIPERVIKDVEIHEFSITKPLIDVKEDEKLTLEAAMSIVDNMEDSEPLPPIQEKELETTKPLNYWECSYCGNKNPLKAPRCRKCAKGKKLVEES